MKKAFASDTAFRVYSVLIAILLWAFVVYNQNPESSKVISGIKVSYTNAAELEKQGLVILKSEREPTLDITVKGRRLSIGKVDGSNVTAAVTVPELRAGTFDVSVDASLPISDVSIIDKKPYTMKVVVENLKTVQIPVETKYSGSPKDAATSVQTTVSPDVITVSGPESVVGRVQSAVVTLDANELSDGANLVEKFKLIAKDGSDLTDDVNLRTNTDVVSVVPSVYHTKDVAVEVQYTGTMPEGYSIKSHSISPATVSLGSKDMEINNVSSVRTEPVDLSQLTANKKVRAKLVVPEGLVNIYSLTEVEITFEIEQTETRSFPVGNVLFQNAETAKSYVAEGLPFDIVLRGPGSVLDTFVPSAKVDVAGLEPGGYSLALQLDLPEGVSLTNNVFVSVTVGANEATTPPSATPTPAL